MRKRAVIALTLLAVIAGSAEAQHQRVISSNAGRNPSPQTAARLLSEFPCNPLWVSKALEDSKDTLRRGRLILNVERCSEAPPRAIAERSKEMLGARASAAPTQNRGAAANAELAKGGSPPNSPNDAYEERRAKENEDMRAKALEDERKAEESSRARRNLLIFLLAFGGLVALVAGLYYGVFRKKPESAEKRTEVRERGKPA